MPKMNARHRVMTASTASGVRRVHQNQAITGGTGREASHREPPDEAKIHAAAEAEGGGRRQLRGGREQKVGADGHGGWLAETEHQQRCQQRASADAGESDEGPTEAPHNT